MSIGNYTMEPGIDVVGSGDGWSIWHEPSTNLWRFDVIDVSAPRSGNLYSLVIPMAGRGMNYMRAKQVNLWFERRASAMPALAQPLSAMQAFIEEKWSA